jgi:hypothetical protein
MNVPPAVRILPMNQREFDGKRARAVQRGFFSQKLQQRNGRFRFYERGLDAESGTVVLFQYDNAVIASATLVDMTKFIMPDDEGYSGYLDFDPATIRVFEPVGPDQMRQVWPEFKEFSQVKQSLGVEQYQAFLRMTLNGATIAESILRAIGCVVGADTRKVFSREEIRSAANVGREWWNLSWNPIFQGMRADHPGRAPRQAAKNQGVLKRVGYGQFVLTAYGWTLVRSNTADEDGRHGAELKKISAALDEVETFNPKDQRDERTRRLAQIAHRRGQAGFRRKLLLAYNGQCAITRCDAKPALEAAHILPYVGGKSNFVSNGILLRSDLHTLFDLDLIGIHPGKRKVVLARSLRGTSYDKFAGKEIALPDDVSKQPNTVALKRRWREFASNHFDT